MLSPMLINKKFLTCCQTIRCQVLKSLLTNTGFNMEFLSNAGPWQFAQLIGSLKSMAHTTVIPDSRLKRPTSHSVYPWKPRNCSLGLTKSNNVRQCYQHINMAKLLKCYSPQILHISANKYRVSWILLFNTFSMPLNADFSASVVLKRRWC